MRTVRRLALIAVLALTHGSATAAEALVATASNFLDVAKTLASEFEELTEYQLTLTSGSTGKLYAQITQGAPYDVLLAADQLRPRTLESIGAAVPGSRFTYATGILTLWSPDYRRVVEGQKALEPQRYSALAIAHPDLAPYGFAAQQALKKMGLWKSVQKKLVFGENIGQTLTFVVTRNAELGFIAKSQAIRMKEQEPGSGWDVPQGLYDPIRQDAVLLQRGAGNEAAIRFLEFLQGPEARDLIRAAGYGTD